MKANSVAVSKFSLRLLVCGTEQKMVVVFVAVAQYIRRNLQTLQHSHRQ